MTDRDALALLQRKYDYLRGETTAQHRQVEGLKLDLSEAQAHRRADAVALAKNRRDIEALGAKIAELIKEKRTLRGALRAEIDDHAGTLVELRRLVAELKRDAA